MHSTYHNLKVMANQGKNPELAELIATIESHPLKDVVFLTTLSNKLMEQAIARFPGTDHFTARLRANLVATHICSHLENIRMYALQAPIPEIK